MSIFHVLLAVGCAACHDTGQRIQMDVLAPSKSDAAMIAENLGGYRIQPDEYIYATRIREAGGSPFAPAMALAA